jgi:hypothetical protein
VAPLSTRSDSKDLAALDVNAGPKPVALLVGEADRDTWRIVELFSGSGLPFDAELRWSAGSGAGAEAWVTVARAARVSVFARSVRVTATNLADKVNRVGVTVADGFATTRNHWEHRALHSAGFLSRIPVPPFADVVRVDLADVALSPLAAVRVLDGVGALLATYPAPLQPPGGIPVGGASALELELAANVSFRAVFHLTV